MARLGLAMLNMCIAVVLGHRWVYAGDLLVGLVAGVVGVLALWHWFHWLVETQEPGR